MTFRFRFLETPGDKSVLIIVGFNLSILGKKDQRYNEQNCLRIRQLVGSEDTDGFVESGSRVHARSDFKNKRHWQHVIVITAR